MSHVITILAWVFGIVALLLTTSGKLLRLSRADRLSLARNLVRATVVTVAVFGGIPAIVLAVCGTGPFYRHSMIFLILRAVGLACLVALAVASTLYVRRAIRRSRSHQCTTTGDSQP